jgi:signal transduction histidine kinase
MADESSKSLERLGAEPVKEFADLDSMADLGELAGPVVHELRNYLNSLLLHLAVLEQGLPEQLKPELEEVRRNGSEVASLLRSLQDYRSRRQSDPDVVDLNTVVQQTIEDRRARTEHGFSTGPPGPIGAMGDKVRIDLSLSPKPLWVSARQADLKRLCKFLIRNAAAAADSNRGHVTIRTERPAGKVLLCVTDTGPSYPAEPARIFEPQQKAIREGTNSLELAACRSLVRRLQGTIRAESNPEQGLSIIVHLPAGSE